MERKHREKESEEIPVDQYESIYILGILNEGNEYIWTLNEVKRNQNIVT